MKYKFFLILFILFILLGIVTGGKEKSVTAHEFALYDPNRAVQQQLGNLENWQQWLLWKQYPPLKLNAQSETQGSINDSSLAHSFTLYLSQNGRGRTPQYVISFNSEPLTTAGYCQIDIAYSEAGTGHADMSLQCAESYLYKENDGWWTKTFRPNAELPIDMIGSLARLKLLIEQQN